MKPIQLLIFVLIINFKTQAQTNIVPDVNAIADSLKTVFYNDAKRAKLTLETTNALANVIAERNKVIADFDAKRKRYYAPFRVLDPSAFYTYKIEQAKKLYANKIKNLLTYEQYFQFVEQYFRDEAKEKANEEVKPIFDSNPTLKSEQKTALFDFVYNHYLNYKVSFSYYNGDITLQKVKQSSMKFAFEMKFAKMLKDFNIKAEKMNPSSANNLQWN